MPAGCLRSDRYRERARGSVVPCLRWRSESDEVGVIRHGFMRRVGNGRERHGNGKTPVGNGWNGWNGSQQVTHKAKEDGDVSPIERSDPEPVPAVPSIPSKGSGVPQPFPTRSDPFQIDVLNARTGQWEPGWRQITTGSGSGSVLCSDPKGHSRQVERKRIRQTQALR